MYTHFARRRLRLSVGTVGRCLDPDFERPGIVVQERGAAGWQILCPLTDASFSVGIDCPTIWRLASVQLRALMEAGASITLALETQALVTATANHH